MKFNQVYYFFCVLIGSYSLSPLFMIAADYAYQKTSWYKTRGRFIEQSEINRAQRDKLLGAHQIGLYVTNNTPYPARVRIVQHQNRKYAGSQEQDLPAGVTAELLGNALDKQYVYTITASVVQSTPSKSDMVYHIGIPSSPQKSSGATIMHFITTQQAWTSSYPTTGKLELVLELTEKQGAQPLLLLRQK